LVEKPNIEIKHNPDIHNAGVPKSLQTIETHFNNSVIFYFRNRKGMIFTKKITSEYNNNINSLPLVSATFTVCSCNAVNRTAIVSTNTGVGAGYPTPEESSKITLFKGTVGRISRSTQSLQYLIYNDTFVTLV